MSRDFQEDQGRRFPCCQRKVSASRINSVNYEEKENGGKVGENFASVTLALLDEFERPKEKIHLYFPP